MGLFDKLFGKKPAPPAPTDGASARLAEIVKHPPRLINEGPEFPDAPIILRRQGTTAETEAALTAAGFIGDGDRWTRDGTTVQRRTDENGLHLLELSGDRIREAQRAILGTLAWVDPRRLYDELEQEGAESADVCYLLWATRHYHCAGGVPAELRMHPDADIKETIRLIDRAQMADAARAQRRKR